MTFSVDLKKEQSADPHFRLNVSVYSETFCVKNAQVDVFRVPPKVNIQYPEALEVRLDASQRKKLDLEILNKVIEHIMETT